MHDGVPYDPIQGQGQGHGASEVPKIGFLIFVLVFVSHDLELGVIPAVSPSTKKFYRFQ